ncbi:MAG: hypothetical protein IPG99_11675 [Ignavibacteria bacterium]|nr:hypothetical protein [Ignavibacteria bacterium]
MRFNILQLYKSYAMDSLSGFKHNSAATDDVTEKLSEVAVRYELVHQSMGEGT